jgi:uncharacterized protein (DUF2062 family)
MILKRRQPRTKWQKIREILWPSMGWMKLIRYYKHRIGRLPGSPEFIASGFATGVAISFTPFVGFHLLTAGIIVWIFGGSLVAMVLGTVVAGNPWTYPFIWLGTYKLGETMMGGHETRAASAALTHQLTFSDLLDKPMELLLPMTLGSLPPALVSWIISFYFVRHVVKRYKQERLSRIHKH